MFTLKIKTGGAAFRNPYDGGEDAYYAGAEVCRILKKIESDIRNSDGCITSGTIMDINGNKVGEWKLED